MVIPDHDGRGRSLSEQVAAWTKESMIFGNAS